MRDRDHRHRGGDRGRKLKRKIFQDLCPRIGKNTLIATNTSSISVTRLAASTDRPEHFIGLHFMNPVPMMQLVEVIRGIATDDVDLPGRARHRARASARPRLTPRTSPPSS